MYTHKNGIIIRKLSKNDLPVLLKLKQESWWGTHKTPLINDDDQNYWYNSLPNNTLATICEFKENIVGVSLLTNIDWISRTANISGSIIKEYRIKNIIESCCAAEIDFSFEMLNLHRLEAEVLSYNIPAQHFEINYLKFVLEGRKRKSVYKSGDYFDSLVLGLLRSEWEQQERVLSYQGSCNTIFDISKLKKMEIKSLNKI